VDTSDYTAYVKTLSASVEEMRQTPPFEVLKWRASPPMKESSIVDMETYISQHQGLPGFHVLPAMRPFYRVANGFRLNWVYWKPSPVTNNPPNGKAALPVLSALYAPVDEEERDLAYDEGYRVFDSINASEEVVLKFQRGVDEPAFFFHHIPSDSYHPLALDFPTYMDLLLQTRALYPWQHFFITSPGSRIDDRTREGFFDDLARLFPDADASRFRR